MVIFHSYVSLPEGTVDDFFSMIFPFTAPYLQDFGLGISSIYTFWLFNIAMETMAHL